MIKEFVECAQVSLPNADDFKKSAIDILRSDQAASKGTIGQIHDLSFLCNFILQQDQEWCAELSSGENELGGLLNHKIRSFIRNLTMPTPDLHIYLDVAKFSPETKVQLLQQVLDLTEKLIVANIIHDKIQNKTPPAATSTREATSGLDTEEKLKQYLI